MKLHILPVEAKMEKQLFALVPLLLTFLLLLSFRSSELKLVGW